MQRRVTKIAWLVLASIILPMVIGSFDGLGLSRAADGNQTFPFAESYYKEIIVKFRPYQQKRDNFSFQGFNRFGMRVVGQSECQDRLGSTFVDEEMLVSAALSSQAANVLADQFDYPAIKALEELPSVVTGSLKGCRYTLLSTICTNWARSKIMRANHLAQANLITEKRNWLHRNENASCKAADKFGAKKILNMHCGNN